MTVYVVLLRGINVGGNNKIAMTDLRKLLADLGFSNVITYIQSGNLVFKSEVKDPSLIEEMIKQGIREKFSLNIEVIAKSLEELSKIIRSTPFKEADSSKGEKIYLTFLSKKPSGDLIEKLEKVDGEGDKILVEVKTGYILCKKGYSETVYNNNFIERTLNVIATSRNFQTTKKLEEIGTSLC
jgi:uncharacterized protein (DUF1697 family)